MKMSTLTSPVILLGTLVVLFFGLSALPAFGQGEQNSYDLSDAPLTEEEWEEIMNMDADEQMQRFRELQEEYGRVMDEDEIRELEEAEGRARDRLIENELRGPRLEDARTLKRRNNVINSFFDQYLTAYERVSHRHHVLNTERFENIAERLRSRIEKTESELGIEMQSERSSLDMLEDLFNEKRSMLQKRSDILDRYKQTEEIEEKIHAMENMKDSGQVLIDMSEHITRTLLNVVSDIRTTIDSETSTLRN